MAILSIDNVVAALPGQRKHFARIFTPTNTGRWNSLWALGAGIPGVGAAPGSTAGTALDDSSAGSLLTFTNPGGGNLSYLGHFAAGCQNAATLVLYDRLIHSDGLSGTVSTAQTIGTPSLPARASAELDVEVWIEVYTQLGVTSRTATISYTNQSGTSGRTSGAVTIPATAKVGELFGPFPLQGADTGVQAVASLTLSGSTGTAGSFGITLARRIAHFPLLVAGAGVNPSLFDMGLPQIKDDSCLSFMHLNSSTSQQTIQGTLALIQG